MKHTGTSMGGGIIDAKRVRPIPCDCGRCYHKRRNSKERYNYCSYYGISFPTIKKRCARYYGPPVGKTATKNTNESKSCKSCIHYIVNRKRCDKFNFDITTYGLGSKCKGYSKEPLDIKLHNQIHYNSR